MIFYKSEFISYLQFEKRYSEHTLISYTKDISQFFDFLSNCYGELDLESIRHQQVRSWIVELMQQDVSEKSINRKISALRTYFKFLMRSGKLKINPCAKIQAPRIPKRVTEYMHEEDLQKTLDIIEWGDEPFLQARNKLIFYLLYSCGLRRSELIQLKIEDVDSGFEHIKVMGKGAKERQVPLLPRLKSMFEDYIAIRLKTFGREESHVFLTIKGKPVYPKLVYNLINEKLSQVSSIKKKSPHMLRHSFATHLSNAGAEINAIKDLLGHSSLAATQIYTQNSIQKLKKAHLYHPRSRK